MCRFRTRRGTTAPCKRTPGEATESGSGWAIETQGRWPLLDPASRTHWTRPGSRSRDRRIARSEYMLPSRHGLISHRMSVGWCGSPDRWMPSERGPCHTVTAGHHTPSATAVALFCEPSHARTVLFGDVASQGNREWRDRRLPSSKWTPRCHGILNKFAK